MSAGAGDQELHYVLITEGSSDRSLQYPINWLLARLGQTKVTGAWADMGLPAASLVRTLVGRIQWAAEEYGPWDLVFIHRDADRRSPDERRLEILDAARQAGYESRLVCVVPVRMMEAWFLHDEAAIRRAAGNPNGSEPLVLPRHREVESEPDPKAILMKALEDAGSPRRRYRRRKRRERFAMRRVIAREIETYEPLRQLPAFQAFEKDLREALDRLPT